MTKGDEKVTQRVTQKMTKFKIDFQASGMNYGQNTPLEIIGGFEDIGIRFLVKGDDVTAMVPEGITLSDWEEKMLRQLQPDIKNGFWLGLLLPVDA